MIFYLRSLALVVTVMVAGAQLGWAQFESIEVTPIVGVEGADDNSVTLVTQLADGCYSPLQNIQNERGDQIVVVHLARVDRERVCVQVISYHRFKVDTSNLRAGTYTLIDGYDSGKIADIEKTSSGTELVRVYRTGGGPEEPEVFQ